MDEWLSKHSHEDKNIYDTFQSEEREEGEIGNSTVLLYFRNMTWFCLVGYLIFNFSFTSSITFIDFWLKS